MTDTPTTFQWSSVRGIVLRSIVGSVIVAAAIAIFAIVVGSFGILEAKLLTFVLLFVLFALGCLFDAAVVAPKNEAFAYVGIFVNFYLLVVGILKVAFAGLHPGETDEGAALYSAFWLWIWLVTLARLGVGYAMLVVAERKSYRYNSLEALIAGTLGALFLLTLFVSLPSIFSHTTFPDYFYRLMAVLAVLTVLGTVLIPLVGRLFGERLAKPAAAVVPGQRLRWPVLENGTPLPKREDGSPDYSVVTSTGIAPAPEVAPKTDEGHLS